MDKDKLDNVLSQIPNDQMKFISKSYVNGFGPDNLLISNSNGWYDDTKGSSWVQIDFKSSRKIRIVGIKSNSEHPIRDPVELEIIGKSEGEWFYFAKIKHLNIDARNMWKDINLIYNEKLIDVLKINFLKNSAFVKEEGNWGEGVQISELIFFE